MRKILYAAAVGAPLVLGLASPAAAAPAFFSPTGTLAATDTNCTLSAPPLPSDNCAMAGYEASGRTFRFAQALITIPDHAGSKTGDPALYVALDNSGTSTYQYTRVGLAPCPAGVGSTAILVPGATPTSQPATQ